MKHVLFSCTLLVISVLFLSCEDNPAQPNSGMRGQVYDVSSPGPAKREPVPLAEITTVVVLNSDRREVLRVMTDSKGSFEIPLNAGTYYLLVSESPVPSESGPYTLVEGDFSSVVAYYDAGML